MQPTRALDGDEDTASGSAQGSIESDEQRDVVGVDQVDPSAPGGARSRRHPCPARRGGAAVDGLACIACFEPLAASHLVRVLIVGGAQSAVAHVDCRDPGGLTLPSNQLRRVPS